MTQTLESIDKTQQKIIQAFQMLGDDWMQRYQYLIDLGKKLPPFPEDQRLESHRLHGCQSQVWIKSDLQDGRLHFQAVSDSTIVCGLIALLLRIYSNREPREILTTPPLFVSAIGLDKHLSPTRRNGLHAMLQEIQHRAVQAESAVAAP